MMQKKLENGILLFQLEERYKAMHVIRDGAHNISIWMLGLFFTGAGWLTQSKSILGDKEKLFLSFIIFIFYLTVRCYYLRDLHTGFTSQQRTAARIEKELGLFDGSNPILPKEWGNSGGKKCNGKFFDATYAMVGLGTAILLLGILVNGMF